MLVVRFVLLVLQLAEHVDHALRGVARGGHAGVGAAVLAAHHAGLVVDLRRWGFRALWEVRTKMCKNNEETIENHESTVVTALSPWMPMTDLAFCSSRIKPDFLY